MKIALICSGQGSQYIGMAKFLYDNFKSSQLIMDEACDILQEDLKSLMFEGPLDILTLTQNAQPCLLINSIMAKAALEEIAEKKIQDFSDSVAGHSLGEYSALCVADSISFKDALFLVKVRGNAMSQCVDNGIGGMAAILGLNKEQVLEIVLQTNNDMKDLVCEIANFNTNEQIVISGHLDAVKHANALAKQKGAKRALLLPVSAPFHSSLMQKAAEIMSDALKSIEFKQPSLHFYSNVTANNENDISTIKRLLVEQTTNQVRWTDLINNMLNNGITDFIELGAGKVLCGLVKKIHNTANVHAIECMGDVDGLMQGVFNK